VGGFPFNSIGAILAATGPNPDTNTDLATVPDDEDN